MQTVMNRVMQEGAAFDVAVYNDLLNLYQRSHTTYDHKKTQECMAKLAKVLLPKSKGLVATGRTEEESRS